VRYPKYRILKGRVLKLGTREEIGPSSSKLFLGPFSSLGHSA